MLLFFVSSLAGVTLSFVHVSYVSLIISVILFIFSSVCLLYTKDEYVKKVLQISAIIFIGVSFGQIRILLIQYPDITSFHAFESKRVAIQGIVIREPVSDGEVQKIELQASGVSFGEITQTIDTKILIRTNPFPEFSYGDMLVATGTLSVPEKIVSEDGREFDYQMYLFKDSVTHTLSFGLVEKVGQKGNVVLRDLFGIKRAFIQSIRNVLPEPHAGLLGGILLGTETLSKPIKENFRTAGLSHIVVLSGYNITVVAESILVIMKYVSLKFAFGISFLRIIFFVLMAGSGASAIRAGIMASIALLGKQYNKTYDASRALVLAVWVMVLWNPFIILYDPSFHLSVLATIGVMYVTPLVVTYVKFITEKFGLRELSATTLGAQLAVLPYILYMSGNFGIFSFPANFIVLPFVPLTMLLGFFTAVLGFVSRFIGLIPGIPTYLFLSWDLFVAEIISKLPFATIRIPYIPFFLLILIYIIFGFFLYRFHMKKSVMQNPSTAEMYSADDSVVGY